MALRRGSEETVRVRAGGRRRAPAGRRGIALALSAVLALGVVGAAAPPASADTAPAPGVEQTVSADPLPTAQIDGVVWAQAVTGSTVWVGGEFTRARPAGAAPGTGTSPRANLMAYDIRTGVMTAWNPGANGVVKTITRSPDGSRIYVGGTFTSIAGQTRHRVAAFDSATGALLPWAPAANYTVSDIAASGGTVFLVGGFTALSGGARTRLGAVTASTGALLPLSATLTGGYGVNAIVVDPTGSKIVVAGSFESTNGQVDPGRGMAALDASSGASLPWAVNALIRNAGTKAAMTSLTSDGDSVYGTGYDFGGGPEDDFEGTFRARWSDGALVWLEDCHGDNYSVAVSTGVVYTASHDHYCGNVGGFPQSVPSWTFRHTLAFAKEPRGLVLTPDIYGYKSYTGRPAPTTLHWYPNWQVGTYTGKSQATWDVVATDDYVLYGGEFPQVNGVAQQGLVRFAKKAIAPNRSGPEASGSAFPVNAVSLRAGEVRLTWTANTDRDNQSLSYQVQRQDRGSTPVCTVTADSNFWTMPQHHCVDATAVPGATHQYRVRAADAFGNEALGAWSAVAVATADRGSAYSRGVVDDGALHYWPLSEQSGAAAADIVGGRPLTLAVATRGVSGPAAATLPAATRFTGSASSYGSTTSAETGRNALSVEGWVRTTSTRGGKIVAFGNLPSGSSSMHDRSLYLDNAGRITFGVNQRGYRTISSSAGFNDGRWHHVVGTLSPAGMVLFVDGVRIGGRTDTTSGQSYTGYWRIGGDSPGSWPNSGSSGYLAGDISDVAVYGSALTAAQVLAHHQRATSTAPANSPPVASFTSQVSGSAVSVDGGASSDPDGSVTSWSWTFGDGATAAGVTATHTYAVPGTYTVELTVSDDRGATSRRSAQVTATAPPPGVVVQDAFERTVSAGWGVADTGATWAVSPTAAAFSVASGAGVMRLASSTSLQASLGSEPRADATVLTAFTVDKIAHAQYVSVIGRRIGADQYLLRVRIAGDGTLQLHVMRNGTAIGAGYAVPGAVIVPGAETRVAFRVSGTAPTTLDAKVWSASAPEPADWQVTRTDSTPALQAPGSVALSSYVPAAAGAYPLTLSFLDLSVTAP